MFQKFGAVLSATAAMVPSPSFADVLHPIANWVVDYREDQCLASRDYGSAAKPVTLGIRPAPTGETYELLVARPGHGPDYATESKGAVDFGKGPIRAWLLSYGGKTSKSDIYQFRITAAEMEQASSAATVIVSPEGAPNLTFELRSMPALLKGLKDCTADLRKYWNSDDTNFRTIATQAKGDIRSVFTADDYPRDAIQRNQGGTSQFLLLIDEKGAVAGCHVMRPSGVPVLDAMSCQVIRKRAKFTPARDAEGHSVRSSVITPPIVWRMEG
jgi:TonB family protein